jgi:hypothetical protein
MICELILVLIKPWAGFTAKPFFWNFILMLRVQMKTQILIAFSAVFAILQAFLFSNLALGLDLT